MAQIIINERFVLVLVISTNEIKLLEDCLFLEFQIIQSNILTIDLKIYNNDFQDNIKAEHGGVQFCLSGIEIFGGAKSVFPFSAPTFPHNVMLRVTLLSNIEIV